VPVFVGRAEPLARLIAVHRSLAAPPGAAVPTWAGLALVTGEAGIGKTTLLTRFAADVAAAGATVAWGTCWDGDQAPAWWPWTQVLRALLDRDPGLAGTAGADLAAIVPELGTAPGGEGARVRVFEATARVLARAAASAPVVVLLDDLHRADPSTVDLLRFVAHQPEPGRLMLVGAYRPREPSPAVATTLAELATAAELVPLVGLSGPEVAELVRSVTGGSHGPQGEAARPALAEAATRDGWAALIHERSGGHPFFARELCHLLWSTGTADGVPAAVREVIERRLARLSGPCVAMLDAASVAGGVLQPDVLADVCGADAVAVAALVAEATAAGIIAPERFVHDLYRETIYTRLAPGRRVELHHRVATALLHRQDRGAAVFAAELAHHFAAAVPAAGTAPALAWAREAATADAARFAFAEAAGHLTRLRSAVAAAGQPLPGVDLVGVLTAEADLRLRSGDAAQARALLSAAWAKATATGAADLLGAVSLGLDRVDARFAMPRAELVAALDTARKALRGSGTALEATVTAALARQLQHSVPADRPRARPLADEAVRIARTLDDPATLASCLLAQHDTRWTAGTATTRAQIAAEIAALADRAGDPERHAQALLLTATAQLENASPAFRATVAEFAYRAERLRQPRHDYVLRTRQAALALLDGDIETGDRLSAEAAALGTAIGDGDTGNVRMSQRLEIVRARGEPDEQREIADEAIRWWIGAPAHAHAVAAGFRARAGDLEAARRELDTVLALDWHSDRSYLWSVFIGELVTAAIAVSDGPLCRRLLTELRPLAGTCAINGALVCFMGAHDHRIGLLHTALGEPEPAREALHRACEIHRRLGARAWLAETRRVLSQVENADEPERARLRLVGDMWEASYRGRTAFLRDVKGLRDLAALLARPGTDLAALELAGSGAVATVADPVLDRTALAAYRARLADLDDEIAAARDGADLARQRRATDEREYLLAELRRATRPDGTARAFGGTAAERARKAVTARIRDAIRRIAEAHPEFGAHLDRTIRTGTTCRYDP
jgi:hypothetical protein